MSKGWTGHDEEIDWDSAGNNALPDGVYTLKVAKAEARPTRDGKPSVSVELLIETNFSTGEKFTNRKVFDTLTVTKEAAFKIKNLCKASGVCPPRSGSFEHCEEFANAIVDMGYVNAVLKQDTYDGQTRNKVKVYLSEEETEKAAAKFAA